ncbi:MAG: hypothetical protein V4490_05240 [Pseudomonadota bacterium]
MRLIDTIKMQLDPMHIKKINQIDDFDFSKTLKKVNADLGGLTAKYLQEGIENLKRYYVVALLDPLNEHAVSRPVDPFWHAHILHTKDYELFCQSIFGQYVHHSPLDIEDSAEVQELTSLYTYTLKIYSKIFHSFNSDWWPAIDDKATVSLINGPIVCLHMSISTEEICSKSLFAQQSKVRAA